jgi:hypothetical protein
VGLRTVVFGATITLSACLLALPGSAPAASVRVPPEYFGINFQNIDRLDSAGRETQLAQLAAAGIPTIRINLSWQVVEPMPQARGNSYQWQRYDAIIGDSARHGIRVTPTIVQSPYWNTPNDPATETFCRMAQSQRPLEVEPYVDLARAVALRYGAGGAFWRDHPELAAKPVTDYEIWNEENLNGGWCPAPDPRQFAAMFSGAAGAIHQTDPSARVIIGGVAEPVAQSSDGMPVADFLAEVTASHPEIKQQAAGVAIHIYPEPTKGGLLYKLKTFRSFLRAGGIPRKTPMVVNEVGWPTRGVDWALDEPTRMKGYRELTRTIPRSNCNVSAVLPHTWWSAQNDPANPEDWFGIADPQTGAPSGSASTYAAGIRLQRGQTRREAKRRTIRACRGMPLPDQDAEGVPDQRDYFPLVPGRAARRTRKGMAPVECSVRLTAAWQALASATPGADAGKHRAAYRRLRKRCMPCGHDSVAILRRLERRILASRPLLRVKRRAMHVTGIRRCIAERRRFTT